MIKKFLLILFIIFTQLAFFGCLNKKGSDKYPEIPNFPKTTNNKIQIKHIMDKYANNFFYSDSLLINFTSDTIETYDVLKRSFTKEKLSFVCYNNAAFICFQNQKYIAIDDENFSKRALIYYDEEYKKFSEISDSLRILKKDDTQDLDSELIDSLFINYFYKKHNIKTKNDLFADKIGTNYYYVKTNTSEFIIYNAPSPLIDIFDEAWYNKKIIKKNDFKTIEAFDNNDKSIFEYYDFALIDRSWNMPSGGNHFILPIPYMSQTNYYYYKFDINGIKGKFKLLTNGYYFNDLSKLKNNRFLTSINQSIYEVTLLEE